MIHRDDHSALAARLPMGRAVVRPVVVSIPALLLVAGITDQENVVVLDLLLLGLLILLISLLIVG